MLNENASTSKKSIFALMFENTPPEKFGIKENSPLQKMNSNSAVPNDLVVPSANSFERPSTNQQLQASSLLTGDGLICSGLSKAQAANELQKIHAENLQLLYSMTQEEILEEQIRVKELLGKYCCVL